MFSLNSANSVTKNMFHQKDSNLPPATRIFKLGWIHVSVSYQIPWIHWIPVSFWENSLLGYKWSTFNGMTFWHICQNVTPLNEDTGLWCEVHICIWIALKQTTYKGSKSEVYVGIQFLCRTFTLIDCGLKFLLSRVLVANLMLIRVSHFWGLSNVSK